MSTQPYTVVSFFTPEYLDCVAAFGEAASSLGLPHEVEQMDSLGNWQDNTGLKPKALLLLRERVHGPLLYLDVDTKLLRAPALPPGRWDLALAENPVKAHVNRIAAQCLFVADTMPAREFLRYWFRRVAKYGGRDHGHLTVTVGFNREAVIGKADFTGCLHLNGLRLERTQALA